MVFVRRLQHARSGQVPGTRFPGRVGIRAVQHGIDPGQTGRPEFPAERPERVRRGAVRELRARVFRGAGPQVRGSRRANPTVVHQRPGVPVARAAVRPGVRARVHHGLHGPHDVRAAGPEHGQCSVQHVAGPSVLLAPATGPGRQTFRVPGPRATAPAGRHAPQRVVDAGQQPPDLHWLSRAHGARIYQRGRHALRPVRTATRGNDSSQDILHLCQSPNKNNVRRLNVGSFRMMNSFLIRSYSSR